MKHVQVSLTGYDLEDDLDPLCDRSRSQHNYPELKRRCVLQCPAQYPNIPEVSKHNTVQNQNVNNWEKIKTDNNHKCSCFKYLGTFQPTPVNL